MKHVYSYNNQRLITVMMRGNNSNNIIEPDLFSNKLALLDDLRSNYRRKLVLSIHFVTPRLSSDLVDRKFSFEEAIFHTISFFPSEPQTDGRQLCTIVIITTKLQLSTFSNKLYICFAAGNHIRRQLSDRLFDAYKSCFH